MKKVSAVFAALFLAGSGNAQLQYNWHIAVGDASWSNYQNNLRDVEIGDSNFVYMAGLADGTPDIDGGPGVVTVSSQGFQTAYIVVNDPAGNYARSWIIETNNRSEIRNITIAGNGDVIAVGSCTDTTDFDPGPGVYDSPYYGSFIARYTKYGQLVWAHVIPSVWNKGIGFDAVDEENGRICVGGAIVVPINDSLDIDPGPGTHYQYYTPHCGTGALMSLDASGNYLVSVIPAGSYVYSVCLTPSGEMVATGGVTDTIDFNPGPPTYFYIPRCNPCPFGDFCVMRYSATGGYIWHYASGIPSSESAGYDLRLDAAGNIYVLGSGGVDVDPGPLPQYVYAPFLIKYLPNGLFSWTKPCSAFDLDANGYVYIYDNNNIRCYNSAGVGYWSMPYAPIDVFRMRTSSDGNLYLGGGWAGGADYDPGPGVVMDPAWSGASSWFVICLHHLYAGINTNETQTLFSVYPNPASDILTVSRTDNQPARFTIFTSIGEVIAEGELEGQQTQINISAFANGVYFLRTDDSENPLRFIVNH